MPQSEDELRGVFLNYVIGEIKELPWCESGGRGLSDESERIVDDLLFLNAHGFLTINSQPKANCVASDDPVFGWGSPGGFVFQKAYVEAWISPDQWSGLRQLCALPEFSSISFMAINAKGEEETNIVRHRDGRKRCVNAVTWGVFPGQEIQQPTVVDYESFRTWAAEAFELWRTVWRRLYDDDEATAAAAPVETSDGGATVDFRNGNRETSDCGADDAVRRAARAIESDAKAARARARGLLTGVHDTYWLVNIVDQSYHVEESDVFAIFRRLVSNSMGEAELRTRVVELEGGVAALRDDLLRAGELHQRTLEHVGALERNNARLRRQLHEARTAALEQEARAVIARPAARAGALTSTYSPTGSAGAAYRKSSQAKRSGRGSTRWGHAAVGSKVGRRAGPVARNAARPAPARSPALPRPVVTPPGGGMRKSGSQQLLQELFLEKYSS
jgi:hypothetical protein